MRNRDCNSLFSFCPSFMDKIPEHTFTCECVRLKLVMTNIFPCYQSTFSTPASTFFSYRLPLSNQYEYRFFARYGNVIYSLSATLMGEEVGQGDTTGMLPWEEVKALLERLEEKLQRQHVRAMEGWKKVGKLERQYTPRLTSTTRPIAWSTQTVKRPFVC